jgi:hypothetical protein
MIPMFRVRSTGTERMSTLFVIVLVVWLPDGAATFQTVISGWLVCDYQR